MLKVSRASYSARRLPRAASARCAAPRALSHSVRSPLVSARFSTSRNDLIASCSVASVAREPCASTHSRAATGLSSAGPAASGGGAWSRIGRTRSSGRSERASIAATRTRASRSRSTAIAVMASRRRVPLSCGTQVRSTVSAATTVSTSDAPRAANAISTACGFSRPSSALIASARAGELSEDSMNLASRGNARAPRTRRRATDASRRIGSGDWRSAMSRSTSLGRELAGVTSSTTAGATRLLRPSLVVSCRTSRPDRC